MTVASSPPHTHRVQIRFADIDLLGHVNNACYHSYLEDARVAFFKHVSLPTRPGKGRVLARLEIDYIVPLFLSDIAVDIVTWVEKVGGRSSTLIQEIRRGDVLHSRGRSVIVAFDKETQSSRDLYPEEAAALRSAIPPSLVENA